MKNKVLSSMLVFTMVLGLAACGSQTEEEVEEAEETEEIAEEEAVNPLTEADLDDVLDGVEDHYVLQDAKDVDYMSGVTYDKTVEMTEADEKKTSDKADDAKGAKSEKKTKVIHSVTVDDSKVDASTPGTYKVTYTVKVNRPAYDEYVAQKAEEKDEAAKTDEKDEAEDETKSDADDKSEAESKTDEAAEETKADEAKDDAEAADKAGEDKTDEEAESEDEDVDETDLEDVIIEKDIEIVDEEKAKDLVEEGETVWTDESKDYGETLEEEKKSSESTPNTGSDAAADDASKSDDSSSKDAGSSSSGSSSSSNSGNSSSSSSSSSSSKSTSCDHNWVATTHEATGHYEKVLVSAAYDEKVENGDAYVCNKCGYSTQSSSDIALHCKPTTSNAQARCDEKGTSYSVKTQYTTVHHDAVYENKWVQDSAAYTTYKCSKCGATK